MMPLRTTFFAGLESRKSSSKVLAGTGPSVTVLVTSPIVIFSLWLRVSFMVYAMNRTFTAPLSSSFKTISAGSCADHTPHPSSEWKPVSSAISHPSEPSCDKDGAAVACHLSGGGCLGPEQEANAPAPHTKSIKRASYASDIDTDRTGGIDITYEGPGDDRAREVSALRCAHPSRMGFDFGGISHGPRYEFTTVSGARIAVGFLEATNRVVAGRNAPHWNG